MPGLGSLWSKEHWSLAGSLEGNTSYNSFPGHTIAHCEQRFWCSWFFALTQRSCTAQRARLTVMLMVPRPCNVSCYLSDLQAFDKLGKVKIFLFRWKFARSQVGFSFQAAALQWGKKDKGLVTRWFESSVDLADCSSHSLKSSSLPGPWLAAYICSTRTLKTTHFLLDVLFPSLKSSKAQ